MPARNDLPSRKARRSHLGAALSACRRGLAAVAGFSLFINLLMLTLPLYMLQIFDRVILGRSTETLFFLTVIALGAILVLGALEAVRSLTMVRVGIWLEQRLAGPVFRAGIIKVGPDGSTSPVQGLRDLGTLRTYLTGSAVFSLADAPWTPVFLVVIFLLHPTLGWIALGGAALLLALALANDLLSRPAVKRAGAASISALQQAEVAGRNADAIQAMGLTGNLTRRWEHANAEALKHLSRASDRNGVLVAASKFCRFSLQMGVLGAGAWLVLQDALTAGGMIAGSILLGRALAPVDQAIGSWKSAVGARAAYLRLRALLSGFEEDEARMPLPAPEGRVCVDGLAYGPPGSNMPLIRGLEMEITAGESIGIVGPSASGKTTLARLLVGNLRPHSGAVRLDGANIANWESEDLGPYIGYLPQDIELFDGTVRENIARMGEGDPDAVIAAAKFAGVHEMIVGLDQGYDTEIGAGGVRLSGGQRQRIALARALFGEPRLVVLDEPNASLDQDGDEALVLTMAALKARRITTVTISHRPTILRQVDRIVVLRLGAAPAIGTADEIMERLYYRPAAQAQNVEEISNDRRKTA